MKSLVVIPFVIPLVAFLIIKRRVNKSLLALSVAAIVIAYIIIEPYRMYSLFDPNFKSSPKYILQSLYDAYILNKQVGLVQETDSEFFLLAFFGRTNNLVEAAKAIDYNNKVGLDKTDPDFRNNLLLVPFHAIIPRFIWKDKPLQDIGLWFTRKVWGYDFFSSTSVTPFGFLYFAGGNAFVIIFFLMFGIMQNALIRFVDLGSGGIIVFIGLLSTVVLFDHAVNSIFISWIRLYPILILLQYFVFKGIVSYSK